MKYILITVRKIFILEIITESCETKEEAVKKMKAALLARIKMDGSEKEAEKEMELLEDGIEFSNAILKENEAYIYQDCGEVFHHWKIVEI